MAASASSTRQVRVFVALGSNLGDSGAIVRQAMDRLQIVSVAPIVRSSLWRSDPIDCPPGSPAFINAAIELQPRPDFTPETFLVVLQQLERESGRVPKKVLNEARRLDLDLIAWGSTVVRTERLTLPHPRAHERRFVLEPLAEIAPGLVLPGQTKDVAQLAEELRTSQPITWAGKA
ncbi:MAG: 2-amino-4-hydroxy-6-hydroxymethyldihydropteridine diphosphokinase [Verrucomicrobiota bacterium]